MHRVTPNIKWLAQLAAAGLILAACGSQTTALAPSPGRVFLIVMENQTPAEALAGPFTASLAARYAVANNYHAITHPSVPNYLALSSGSTWGVTDDSYHVLPQSDLGDQLTGANVSWRAYMEGLGAGGCIDSPLPYDPGHNPFAFYGGRCPANVVPLTSLATDIASVAPARFSWISPDRCHDEHDCSVTAGDAWLRQEVGVITQSPAWTAGSVLFITWDEDDGSGGNRVLTLVVTPLAHHVRSQRPYDHYSLLATIEDLLGVKRLGAAAVATAMNDLIKT